MAPRSSMLHARLPTSIRSLVLVLWSMVLTGIAGGTRGAAGQGADWTRVSEGDSVRVRTSGRMTVTASFNRWQADRMLVNVTGFSAPYEVQLSDMERMDAYMLRTPRESFRHGAILGAAAGLFAGAALGLGLHQMGVIDDPRGAPGEIVTDALTYAGIGLALGTLIGGFYSGTHPGHGWIQIAIPTP